MYFLIGWMVGERAGRGLAAVNRENDNALWGIVWWSLIPFVCGYAISANFGREYGPAGGAAAIALLLVVCLFRPHGSPFKMMMLSSITFVAGLVTTFGTLWILGCVGVPLVTGAIKRHGLDAIPTGTVLRTGVYIVIALVATGIVGLVMARDLERIYRRQARGMAASDDPRPSDDDMRGGYRQPSPPPASPPPSPPPASPSAPPPKDAWWMILDVDRQCTLADAEAAARALLRTYHPDRWMNLPDGLKADAARRTQEILRARSEAKKALG